MTDRRRECAEPPAKPSSECVGDENHRVSSVYSFPLRYNVRNAEHVLQKSRRVFGAATFLHGFYEALLLARHRHGPTAVATRHLVQLDQDRHAG